jgi:hypothetical protein
MEPNKDRLKLWVQALRSGRFQQARDTLVVFDHSAGAQNRDKRIGHCCLGVAIEVALENGYVHEHEDTGDIWEDGDGVMPKQIGEWFGIPMSPLIGTGVNGYINAVEANDSFGWDFNQIANSVEEYFQLNKGQS